MERRDPDRGKYNRVFLDEYNEAIKILQPFIQYFNGKLMWSRNDFEAFRYIDDGVCLIFYPHKTSASNRHIRVRNQCSREKKRAADMLCRLMMDVRGCTFSVKNMSSCWEKSYLLKQLESYVT